MRSVADSLARGFSLAVCILLFLYGVSGACHYGGKLYRDWKERRRVRKILEEK